MTPPRLFWIEINIVNGRKTRLRADKILELRDDFVTTGKNKEKTNVVRIIMEGGANVVAEGESLNQVWKRLNEALQVPFQVLLAPDRDVSGDYDV